jgi:hypothetical protein
VLHDERPNAIVVDAAGIRLAQLSLFRPAESVLVEDARGRIE